MLFYFEPQQIHQLFRIFIFQYRTFQDLKDSFPGLSRTKLIFLYFPGPGKSRKNPGLSRMRGNPAIHCLYATWYDTQWNKPHPWKQTPFPQAWRWWCLGSHVELHTASLDSECWQHACRCAVHLPLFRYHNHYDHSCHPTTLLLLLCNQSRVQTPSSRVIAQKTRPGFGVKSIAKKNSKKPQQT